eukprot:CAMPEP_0197020028 /NCGR_PEP_ID=MMETSP1384-20130603/701_1 /TAXON_ID=29189 /ORGANISM="Ammonia sp." /LENGTH=36 /DNA_ID= /DNA_START= /DNA_END= /DNA_ORIENTATION=
MAKFNCNAILLVAFCLFAVLTLCQDADPESPPNEIA